MIVYTETDIRRLITQARIRLNSAESAVIKQDYEAASNLVAIAISVSNVLTTVLAQSDILPPKTSPVPEP